MFAYVSMLYIRVMLLLSGMHSREHSTHIHASNTETNPAREIKKKNSRKPPK